MISNACWAGILGIGILILSLGVLSREAEATETPEHLCLIMVSGSEGYSSYETGKALSFHDHLVDTSMYNEGEILFLASPSVPNVDGSATVSNIEDAFEWLEESSSPETEIVIYVFDHQLWIDNETAFRFNDGNITAFTTDSWIDQITCSQITMILNGERSGLGGEILAGSNRDIICSMGSEALFSPDAFNITRSLEDPSADLDNDDKVSYIEAYLKEVEVLQGSGQDPIKF